jgi:hypothetical protein
LGIGSECLSQRIEFVFVADPGLDRMESSVRPKSPAKGHGMLRKVPPKVAGACTIALGALVAVVAGAMIAHPPLSILGAIVLVLATILMSIGCVWLVRRSWDEPWPPELQQDQATQARRWRVRLIVNSAALAVVLAYGTVSAISGSWWGLVFALAIAINPATIIFVYFKLRASRMLQRDQQPNASDGKGS